MSSYTSSLKLILPAAGEFVGSWGTAAINDQITSLVDQSVAGYIDVAMGGVSVTLDNGLGSAPNQARYAYINMTGVNAAALNVIVPTSSKIYYIKNSTTGGFAITVKTAAGTGISVPNGKAMVLLCDGTNVVDAVTYFSSLVLGTALPVLSGGTGVTASTGTGSVVLSTSPTLITPALGTPSALVGTNITGTATAFTASNVTTNANLTGQVTSVGNATTIVGPINNVTIGATTPAAGVFTSLAGGASGTGYSFDSAAPASSFSVPSTGRVLINTSNGAPVSGSVSQCTIVYPGASSVYGLLLQSADVALLPTTSITFANNAATPAINGTIAHPTSTSTTYNTTSDYRLKSNLQPLENSGVFIDALKPTSFVWTSNGSKDVGFIAHEFQEVSPNSVMGCKDEVNDEGNPRYQTMQASSSEVIAYLVAELQSLRKRIAVLEAK